MPVDTKHNNIIVASSWYKGQYKNNGRIELYYIVTEKDYVITCSRVKCN